MMKLSPMIVQALWEIKSPLMQLPHVTEDMQKYFMSKKRSVSSIQQFCEMKEEDRRQLLKILSDDQYTDVMNVCSNMPLIDFKVQIEGKYLTLSMALLTFKFKVKQYHIFYIYLDKSDNSGNITSNQ